ncbi:microtubule-associated protein futsch [Eleginops maclovinus]
MKPDGVATAALEPMETLESNPVNDAAGQDANQAASPVAEEGVPQPTIEETGEAKPDQAKETPAKTGNKTSGDPKAKTTNKAPSKTKPGTTAPSKTTTGSKPNTTQSRLSNGTNKLQTNGMAKKPAPAAVKKTTPTPAPAKKPTGTTPSPALKSKVGEKKPTGASPATNGAKSTTGTAAAKRTVPATTNGVKTSTAAAAAKKPPAPKTASATPTKPPVSKTTRPSVGTPASSRPATGSTRPPTSSTAKSSPATPKTTTPKTSSTTTAKPAASKLTTSTPSGGKPPASQTSRTTTPVKKDVTKPAASASKKPSDSPLTRPSATTKSAKPETPKSASKSDAVAKKPAASKDSKTPARPKAESKPTPAKTPGSKTSASKTPAPKKTVGSSTPTPVKRGPKAVSEPAPEKELAAAVAAAAAIATAAAVIAGPEVPELAAAEEPQLMSSLAEVVQEKAPEPTPEPVRELTPEPVRELTPEPVRELTPEPEPEPESFKVRETSPEPLPEPLSDAELGAEPVHGAASVDQLSADLDRFKFSESAKDTSLGTTVMSPPSSPLGPVSPVRGPQSASSLLDMQVLSDPWDRNQDMAPSHLAPESLVHTEEEKKDQFEVQQTREEEEEEENLFMPSPKAPSAGAQHHTDDFPSRDLLSPHEKEEAVEKADEEINEDDEEEDDEDEEQRRLGHQPSSLGTDMSTSQPSEEFAVRPSAFGGSVGWHGDDLLSGLDSEDVSSCTSSRQLGESDLSSTQHTALLEGTQSSDALVDSSLRGSEGDGNIMSSPNVETLANEEEDERVDDMDLSSERVEEHHKGFQQQQEEEEEEDEEDEDVEMHSEGVTESGGNVDEDDFNEEERLDNLNRSAAPPCTPPTSSWGQTNPFCDTWAQPAPGSSPSPLSDHVAEESETPVLSPAFLARSGPSRAPGSEERKDSADEGAQGLFAGPAEGLCEPGAAPAARSNSETSTPEDLRDYDSSSGVESRSDKQQTPVPPHQADMEQDLGIHLEKGDGEEEEAETLPADEVLGTGPPTAPASAPSSPSTSGDEASDTEGEMQINDPDTPAMMDESARFESPPPTCSLPALTEDEEAGETHAGEGEEDGGGTTPQSANSVASYGFDCTTSNSNAHSMAESCGKSPGIFSLENEEQLPEEAKDPSLIKELTLPSAAAVDLTPFGFPGDVQPGSLDEYMLGGKMPADHLEEVDPLEHRHHLGGAVESGDPGDSQPPYYSTICDKTDSVLAGNV